MIKVANLSEQESETNAVTLVRKKRSRNNTDATAVWIAFSFHVCLYYKRRRKDAEGTEGTPTCVVSQAVRRFSMTHVLWYCFSACILSCAYTHHLYLFSSLCHCVCCDLLKMHVKIVFLFLYISLFN